MFPGLVPSSSWWQLERLRSLQTSPGTCSTGRKSSSWTMNCPGPHFKTLTLFEPKGICTLHHSFLVSTELPLPGEPSGPGALCTAPPCRHIAGHKPCWGTPWRHQNAISVDICSDVISQTCPHQSVTSFTGVTVPTKCN